MLALLRRQATPQLVLRLYRHQWGTLLSVVLTAGIDSAGLDCVAVSSDSVATAFSIALWMLDASPPSAIVSVPPHYRSHHHRLHRRPSRRLCRRSRRTSMSRCAERLTTVPDVVATSAARRRASAAPVSCTARWPAAVRPRTDTARAAATRRALRRVRQVGGWIRRDVAVSRAVECAGTASAARTTGTAGRRMCTVLQRAGVNRCTACVWESCRRQ
jgi:hypothetical protein